MRQFLLILFCLISSLTLQGENKQTIGIFAYKVLDDWDPDSVNEGITGSEEAIIYLAQELVKLNYQVVVFAAPPPDSPHSLPASNPRYLSSYNEDMQFDIGISWRAPHNASELRDRARHVYLWPHDTTITRYTAEQIHGFDDVLWLSEWQRQQWISMNPEFARFTSIFGNGIQPQQFGPVKQRKNPYSCIYGSNYARGLELLLQVWPTVKHTYPQATLDIYYGWQHWGLLSPQKEAYLRALVTQYAAFDVREHGLVSHDELNQAYASTSFWTYPCTAPETFCITALRAQLAGAVPVVIEGSALQETVKHGYKTTDQQKYLATLLDAMKHAEEITLEERKKMGDFILKDYTWEAIAKKWKALFDSAPAR